MKAVILAGGKGTRMNELTKDTPKPLLEVGGKTLLAHKIDALPDFIKEVIIVVGYQKEKIMAALGDMYSGRNIVYVDQFAAQDGQSGTGHALWQAKQYLDEDFLVLMGDDIYSKEDIAEVANSKDWVMSTYPMPFFASAADIRSDENGYFTEAAFDYEEDKNATSTSAGDTSGDGSLVRKVNLDICLYKMDARIFDGPLVSLKLGKELGLPHTFFKYIYDHHVPTLVHRAKKWFKVNTPADLEKARQMLG